VNGELIGNLGNLANRTLTFVARYYGGAIPAGKQDTAFWEKARAIESRITDQLERADLRDAFRAIFELSDLANKRFQDGEPWKTRTSNPEAAASLVSDLCYILRDIAVLTQPYMPHAAEKLAAQLGKTLGRDGLDWSALGKIEGLSEVKTPKCFSPSWTKNISRSCATGIPDPKRTGWSENCRLKLSASQHP